MRLTILPHATWRAWACLLLVFIALFVSSAPLTAQGITTGVLAGSVSTALAEPLADALITVTDVSTQRARSVTTNASGSFVFPQLLPGDYEVFAERPGYEPVRVTHVPAHPGIHVWVAIRLEEAAPPVQNVRVMRFSGSADGNRPGLSEWFGSHAVTRMPHPRRELSELLRLSALATSDFTVEALPARLSGFAVDGVKYRSASHATGLRASAFPLAFVNSAELLTNAVDVEWSGYAGAFFSSYMRRGAKQHGARAFASWGGTPGVSAKAFDPGGLSFSDIQAEFTIAGPLASDSANFLIGASVRRYETPLPALWLDTPLATSVVATARNTFGIGLEPFIEPRVARADAFTGFGRFDWQIAERHALEVRATYGVIPQAQALSDVSLPLMIPAELEATDFLVAGTLRSALSSNFSSELRVSGSTSKADYRSEQDASPAVPFTLVVPETLIFGANPLAPRRETRSDVQLAETFHYQSGSHRLKLGVALERSGFDRTHHPDDRVVWFGGAEQFAARTGAAVEPVGAAPSAAFAALQVAAILQDTWRAQPGLEITAGLRYERDELPSDEVILNREWERLTGLANSGFRSAHAKLSPRASVEWDVDQQRRWIFRAAGGVYYDRVDPDILAEVIMRDGRTSVRRQVGALDGWPNAGAAGSELTTLTLLANDFRPPRSTRASVGLTRVLGSDATLHLSAAYRKTSSLPRRVDLNRSPVAALRDQYGRPVYGELVQQGQLVVAQPVGNRRFDAFDVVTAINSDGEATYSAITAALEWSAAERLVLSARYVYSRARDNWFGAVTNFAGDFDPGLDPALQWGDGPADLDLPHRLSVSAEVSGPKWLRLAGVYRYRSGYPFTPGFPSGVDVNGDGVTTNDPAFVDDAVAGVADRVAQWDCLKPQVGSFAARNSCRAAGVHSLDARVALRVLRVGNGHLQIHADAFNVLQSSSGIVDNALYRLDASQPLSTDGAAGTVRIPLIANPQFGETRVPLVPARVLRLGVELNW